METPPFPLARVLVFIKGDPKKHTFHEARKVQCQKNPDNGTYQLFEKRKTDSSESDGDIEE